jgi:site-specific DNA-methyltransferase (adenine-specific)
MTRKVLNNLFIIEPNVICTETYIVTGSFDSKVKAENYLTYMKTKFYRFLLSLRVISQDINVQKFAFIPDFEDYTNQILDKDLYEHFELTRKEIQHIESTIREL